ncbi:tyrosine-type recombinase/integrase [Galbitalea soli]|uniref:Tyrosine-type recombinase/integrase n=2 Tax=Galbitalea soli TaxID=1268042 RepID=A0A7C9TRH6_9MICO|nr:tyrosine-type recombinase/integrase [Galbitalea soli]NEM92197.1 tyrosine-type recombinase/integrase [Galbitalea soli]
MKYAVPDRRSVPLPAFLADAITARLEGKRPDDLVFPSPKGDVLRNGNIRRRHFNAAVKTLCDRNSWLPKITPPSLRHTAASLAISAGATILAVQRILGHASAAMTPDVYSDLFDDDLDAVADAWNERARSTDVGTMWAQPPSPTEPKRSNAATSA